MTLNLEPKPDPPAPADQEVRFPIGYFLIPDGPINIDFDNFRVEQSNYGVDVLSSDPILKRSLDIDPTRSYDQETLSHRLTYLTIIMARWIEINRIPGELVLYYEGVRLGWDLKTVCKAYKRPSPLTAKV